MKNIRNLDIKKNMTTSWQKILRKKMGDKEQNEQRTGENSFPAWGLKVNQVYYRNQSMETDKH